MDRVLQRHDTAERWAQFNPILAEGEMGIITDEPKGFKIGDGVTAWNDLPFPSNPSQVVQEKGQSEGVVMSQKATTDAIAEVDEKISKEISDRGGMITAMENDEFVFAVADAEGQMLGGFRRNGEVYVPKGMSEDSKEAIANLNEGLNAEVTARTQIITDFENEDFVYALLDAEGHVLQAFRKNGEVYIPKGMTKEGKAAKVLLDEEIRIRKQYLDESISSNLIFAVTDKDGHVLIGCKEDGTTIITKGIPTDVQTKLIEIINTHSTDMANVSKEFEETHAAHDKEVTERKALITELQDHDNYIAALVDKEGRVIYGVDKEGNNHFAKNIHFNEAKAEVVEVDENANSIFHIVDKEGRYLMSFNQEGHAIVQRGITLDGWKSKIEITDSQKFLFGIVDSNGGLLCGVDKHGGVLANKIYGDLGAIEEVENEDFAMTLIDSENHLLCAVLKDGTFYPPKFKLPFMAVEEEMEFIYVILDADKRIVWGIRSNGKIYQPLGIPEQVKTSLNEIKELINAVDIKIDNINFDINNIAIDKVMYNGNQGRAYLGNVSLQEPGKTDYCIIMMYGQSLSNGSENPAGFDDPAVEGCYMLGSNVWSTSGTTLQALKVGGTVREDGVATGTRQDTIVSTVNSFVTLYRKERPWDKNTKFIACSLGVGGRTVAQLSGKKYKDGSDDNRYPTCNERNLDTRVKPFFEAVKAIADAEGKTISLSAVFWKQGESDYGIGHIGKTYDEWKAIMDAQTSTTNNSMSGSRDAYYRGLTTLKEDIFALAKQIFGDDQDARPVFMPYSVCGTYINNAYQTINDATSQMAEDQDDVVQVGPTYVVPDYNGGHLSMNGYRWYGEYCAKALYHLFLKGIDWKPMQPYNYEVKDNKVFIYINPIVPPLRFDKYTIDGAYKNLGFSVRMGTVAQLDANKSMTSGGLLQTITDIAIVENCIVLTCGNIEKFTGAVEVSYAGQGESGYGGHNQGAGNLRDSDTWNALYSYRNDMFDHGSRSSRTVYYWTSKHVATDDELSTLSNWDATTQYAADDKVLYDNNGTTYCATATASNKGKNPINSDYYSSYYWGTPRLATEEELAELEYWDASFASQTGYTLGDKVLYDIIEQTRPVVLENIYDNNGAVNKTRPYSPVNYHNQDVKGTVIIGKKYPMQNWCLNFYKRIILG